MVDIPFTVSADLDLGSRIALYLRDSDTDVIIREGKLPDKLKTIEQRGAAYEANVKQLLLSIPNGARFLVEEGERITYERRGASDRNIALFLLGSAWGALCCQRGLLPLHASAVIFDEKVHAFTGPSGAGKSTLCAALAERGLPFFTDDMLIIDPTRIIEGRAVCYAGQKDLKLWSNTFRLTCSEKLGPVRDEPDFQKFYALPITSFAGGSGELASLTVLKNENVRRDRPPVAIDRVSGGMAAKRLRDSVYRLPFADLFMGRKNMYTVIAQLIANVHVQTFDRPLADTEFASSTAVFHDWICRFGIERDALDGSG